jgi:hypothetical protein
LLIATYYSGVLRIVPRYEEDIAEWNGEVCKKMGVREYRDKFPFASCIMMGMDARHFEMINLGKRIARNQAVEYFDKMQEIGLVGQTDDTFTDNSIITTIPQTISPGVPHAGQLCRSFPKGNRRIMP